jgi:hypothetical protein
MHVQHINSVSNFTDTLVKLYQTFYSQLDVKKSRTIIATIDDMRNQVKAIDVNNKESINSYDYENVVTKIYEIFDVIN